LGTQATLCWRQESYQVDVHELATFHGGARRACGRARARTSVTRARARMTPGPASDGRWPRSGAG
jgi:hypothetical protein